MTFLNVSKCVFLILLLFLGIIRSQAKSDAPSVTLRLNEYLIVNTRKMSWYQARAYCEVYGMKLLSLQTEDKSKLLMDWMREEGLLNDAVYWTSGTDQPKKDGNFIWHSTGETFTYTNWVTNMPDNWRGDEHCVELNHREATKWNDNRCWYNRYFICEREIDMDKLVA